MKLYSAVIPSLLVLVPVVSLSGGFSARSRPQLPDPVQVHMKEGGCTLDASQAPALTEVRAVLSKAQAERPLATIADVGEALSLAYGENVSTSMTPMHYEWHMIDGIWVRFCIVDGTYEIDFGARGTVIVTIGNEEPAPLP